MESYAVTAPSIWGGGLNLRYKFQGGLYQIDDIDQTFSDDTKSDLTSFFRYQELYEKLCKRLAYSGRPKKILSLPSSVGCEAYSLATCFAKHARRTGASVEVHMSDISERKLKAADTGVYLKGFRNSLPDEYKNLLIKMDDVLVMVDPYIKNMVKSLPPANILEQPKMNTSYDLVMCMNLLCYLPSLEDKIKAAQYLASLTDDVLCLSYGGKSEKQLYEDDIVRALKVSGLSDRTKTFQIKTDQSAQIFVRDF